jgi:hypothetical protein
MGWTLGDVFVLRHAGFPFDWLERLAWPAAELADADAVLAAEDRLAVTCASRRVALESWMAAVRAGRPTTLPGWLDPHGRAAAADWLPARAALDARLAAAIGPLRDELRRLASDPDVQEAVFLSNPDLHANVWRPFCELAEGRPRTAAARRTERQVYLLMQRLCAKNETVSTFGPMGYGEIVAGHGFQVIRQPTRRRAFLAFWALQELARAVSREPELRPHVPLRLNPLFRFEPLAAVGQDGGAVAVTPLASALVERLAGGARTLSEACARLSPERTAPAEGMRALLPLLRAGALLMGLELPGDELEPGQRLRQAVAALPRCPAADAWVERLDEFEDLRVRFERSRLPERAVLLTAMEVRFTAWTGRPARRGQGNDYADRLLLYEEACSQFAIRAGPDFAVRLAAALDEALNLSAAHGDAVQDRHRTEMGRLVEGLGGRLGLLDYLARAGDGALTEPIMPERPPEGAVVPSPVMGDRYALPDVLLEAASPVEIAAGRWRTVLGRVHHHLLINGWLATFHPDLARFESAAAAWLARQPAGSVVALSAGRRNKGFYRFPGCEVEYGRGELTRALTGDERPRVLATELFVHAGAGGVELRTRNGERRYLYLALADHSTYAPLAALSAPPVRHVQFGQDASTARIMAGPCVYQRRRWQVEAGALAGLRGADLLVAVRRLVREHGLCREVFVRVPAERKPYYLDLDSPFAHELLRHLVGRGGRVQLEEMLPSPEGLWLRDERGRYTCELRLQAVRTGPKTAVGPGEVAHVP